MSQATIEKNAAVMASELANNSALFTEMRCSFLEWYAEQLQVVPCAGAEACANSPTNVGPSCAEQLQVVPCAGPEACANSPTHSGPSCSELKVVPCAAPSSSSSPPSTSTTTTKCTAERQVSVGGGGAGGSAPGKFKLKLKKASEGVDLKQLKAEEAEVAISGKNMALGSATGGNMALGSAKGGDMDVSLVSDESRAGSS